PGPRALSAAGWSLSSHWPGTKPSAARAVASSTSPMLTALQTCFAACGRTLSLTSLSYGPDASRDPARANEVNVGGTETLIAVMAGAGRAMSLLVSGSAEVYGRPRPEDPPLTETAATMPTHAYGRSKLAQERAALGAAADHQLPIAVTRSFNHTGPGQRAEF